MGSWVLNWRLATDFATMGRSSKQNFVYVPHQRRGPISAEFQSPGPAAFNLPGPIGNHGPKESTKASAPAFTFGGKSDIKNKFKTPAPNAYESEKSEDYLEGGIQHSFGQKPETKNKF